MKTVVWVSVNKIDRCSGEESVFDLATVHGDRQNGYTPEAEGRS